MPELGWLKVGLLSLGPPGFHPILIRNPVQRLHARRELSVTPVSERNSLALGLASRWVVTTPLY
jgi:hypothetical protein